MCRHQYDYAGHQSFGGDIPGFAQGAYFPGDEPGTHCRLTGEACGNVRGDAPTECAANTATEWLCPECQKEELDVALWKSGESGKYFCRECLHQWTETELSRAYTALMAFLVREKQNAEDAYQNVRAQADTLRGTLERIREAAGVAA